MLIRNRCSDPDTMIRAGLACLAISLFAQRFVHPPTDFWQGFVAGLSGVLIGLSIVLNVRGLMTARQRRTGGE